MWLLCRRVFIEAPRWTYRLVGSAGGSLSLRAVLLGAVFAAAVGGIWSLVTWIRRGEGLTDAFWYGFIAGIFLCVIWVIYSAIVVLSMEFRERRRTKSS
ncbi:hypothetical protein E1263_37035 [Kribbella antibiotica]|uniref:Uncharacterized protein n=1 Tax=Kribbella antibiotica TaxID=190195 RepID=A0A4R4YQ02_9ACTN|nr:hypothetical protein [Kribbella antibiotica]TDD46219.1 hypothetical protein E1263_37035 [Kribbella antibiotica]